MRKISLILTLMLSVSIAFGQIDSNSITVSASRNAVTAPRPDQAIFSLRVTSNLDATLDDVLAALPGAGITVAYFQSFTSSYIYAPSGGQGPTPALDWIFQFAVPFTKMKDTIALLTSLQQSAAKKNNGLGITFSIQGTQTSVQPQQTCSLPDLLADARAQAQKLADGAGLSVGNILAMSSPTSSGTVAYPQALTLGATTPAAVAATTCFLTVKFALLRY